MGIPATLSSVPAQTPYIQYVATSGQTVFPYPFEITQDSDLVAVANGTTLATDSGYTLSGVGNSTGGNLTFTSGRTVGDIITLYRDIPIERLTQFAQNGGFSSTAFNAEFNNVYLLLQQLQTSIDQCLQIPNTNNPAPTTSLTPGAYASKYLAFDANGNPEPAALTSSGTLTQSILNGLLDPQTPAESAAGVTPVNENIPSHTNTGGDIIVERYISGDPSANDCGVGFRNACLVAAQIGGGRIVARAPLYLFNTWDTVSFYTSSGNLALFCLPANTELAGGGQFFTKLRISQTARTGMYNGGANRTHIIGMRSNTGGQYVHDLEFDWDGIVQAAANDNCYHLRTMSANCVIERCYATQAPITNGIADSSTDTANGGTPLGPLVVRECWFQDSGPNMTGNGVNADLSYVYLAAPGSKLIDCRLFNTSNASHNCGGVECHTAQYTVQGSYFKNLWPAMYLGVQDGVTVSIGSRVEGNYIGYCNSGIQIIDQHNGLKITKNHFEANMDSAGSGLGFGFGDIYTPLNAVTGANSAGTQTGLSIVDNTFDSTLYRQGTTRATSGTTVNGGANITLSVLTGAQLSQNRFVAACPGAVNLNGSTTGPMQDVSFTDNEFVNVADVASGTVGYIQLLASSSAGWGAGPVMQDIFIRSNKFLRSRSLALTNTFPLVATGGGSFTATFTNVRFDNNDVVNVPATPDAIAASVGYTPGDTSGAFTITGTGFTSTITGTAEYQIVNGMVFLTVPSTISGTSNSTGFTLTGLPPLLQPVNAVWGSVPLENNGSLGMCMFSTGVGSGTITLYNGMSQNPSTWTASGTKGFLGTTMTYPVT